mgnify:CR=1 FL=1
MSRAGKIKKNPIGEFQTNNASFGRFPSENKTFFRLKSRGKFTKNRRISMKTGLTKKQKTTDVYYNAKDPLAEVFISDY